MTQQEPIIDPHLAPAVVQAMTVDPNALGDYLGRAVSATSVRITKAGDGLSKQLDIAPRLLQPGERVRVVLEATVTQHTHKPIKKADTWELVQTLEAETVTFADGDDIEAIIEAAAARVHDAEAARRNEMDGQRSIDDELVVTLGDVMYEDEEPVGDE